MALAPHDVLLRVEHLTMRFGGLVAIHDLSFEAKRGVITALIGPNGAGKTTVFNCITGFYKPSEGRIALLHGDPVLWNELDVVTARGQRSLRRPEGALFLLERMPDFLVTEKARVTRTFQNIRLFQGMSPLEVAWAGYFTLNFMYLKFTTIWRLFRVWALFDGVAAEENMLRCVNNNYTFAGFWRQWHATLNKWIIRYTFDLLSL